MNKRRYYREVGIAEFIIEGHTLDQTVEEFGIGKTTIRTDLQDLFQEGLGEEAKRNQELYKKAKIQLNNNRYCNTKSKKVSN